ncbi:MAG: type IV pilus assembly protein PilM [Candidatus Dojkabacteria bacterium]|nr:type IV pilus assembly protein PilM [Candidatus Dojkabacteria bacterium]MDQ7020454.1 type IV pilus assembly protein PilM [Candidatus Dojkabacteria bacterium]
MAKIIEFFGLDFGDYSLKLSYTKRSGNKVTLESLASGLTKIGLLGNDSEEGIDEIAETVKEIHERSGVNTKNCVFSIPEQSVFSRLLVVPEVDEENINDAIHWGIKPLVPTSLDNVSIAFTNIDKKELNGKPYINWYVVAAPKERIKFYRKIATKAGLNLLAIETEALATARLVTFSTGQKEDILILDFGADNSNIILARKGISIYSQTLSTGSSSINKILSADFGFDDAKAEQLKLQFANQTPENIQKIAKAIEPITQMLISEISRTLVYYKEKLGKSEINTVYLTGGGAKLYMLDKMIKDALGINAVLVDPINNMSLTTQAKKIVQTTNVHSYNVALGLSLKGLVI